MKNISLVFLYIFILQSSGTLSLMFLFAVFQSTPICQRYFVSSYIRHYFDHVLGLFQLLLCISHKHHQKRVQAFLYLDVLSRPRPDSFLINIKTVLLLFSVIFIWVLHVYLLSNHHLKYLNTDTLSNGFPFRYSLIFSGIFFLEKNI